MIAILALSTALTGPALAQQDDTDQGFSLMEEGARMIMRGLMAEIGPSVEGLRDTIADIGPGLGDFLREMGPGLATVLNEVDDIRHYSPPEFAPNGDIILRRDPDAPVWRPAPQAPEIEL